MIQKAAAMGNWWLAASSQHVHSCIMSPAEFFGKTSNHPGDSATLQPRVGTLRLRAFPKTKITFEREEISDHQWDSGKCNGAADGNWENWVRSQGAYFEGDWGVIVLCTMFLVSCICNKYLFFILYGWIPSGQTSCRLFPRTLWNIENQLLWEKQFWSPLPSLTVQVENDCQFLYVKYRRSDCLFLTDLVEFPHRDVEVPAPDTKEYNFACMKCKF